MQLPSPEDLVIATGRATSLADFVGAAFAHFGLNAEEWIRVDESLFRPSEIMWSQGNPERAEKVIAWRAAFGVADVVRGMAEGVI